MRSSTGLPLSKKSGKSGKVREIQYSGMVWE